MAQQPIHTDLLIVGTGIAGLSLALSVADQASVVCLAKRDPMATNTTMAQGGIAAAIDTDDSVASHIKDTLNAGDGLCDPAAVESILREAPAAIDQLLSWGVDFAQGDGAYNLTQEGGHGHRRILHAADRTGQAIMTALLARVEAHPNITLLPNHIAIDCLTDHTIAKARGASHPNTAERTCYGLYVLDGATGQVRTIAARVTCLATGGAGKVYRYTTNPDIASGDGLAMAYRAGASVANLEFVQFHPNCLFLTP